MDHSAVEALSYEVAVHDMTEFSQLARILPPIHAAYGGIAQTSVGGS